MSLFSTFLPGTVPADPGLIYIDTVTASAASTIDIEDDFDTYDRYIIASSNITSTGTPQLYAQFDLGSGYVSTSTYAYHSANLDAGSAAYSAIAGQSQTRIQILTDSFGSGASDVASITLVIDNPSSSSRQQGLRYDGSIIKGSSDAIHFFGSGGNTGTGAMIGLRLLTFSTGISGDFHIYGVRSS